MKNMNQQIAIGYVGKDPETREAGSTKKSTFSLGVTETFKRNGEPVKETTWFNIVCWGKLADLAMSYIKKGSYLYVAGPTKNREYTDKEGNKRYISEVIAEKLHFLNSGTKPVSNQESVSTAEPVSSPSDDLPF